MLAKALGMHDRIQFVDTVALTLADVGLDRGELGFIGARVRWRAKSRKSQSLFFEGIPECLAGKRQIRVHLLEP
jgi:hypothetical protein